MKLTGITGTGSGKLGSSVFAVNSGVQIVRQYQPVVSNPSTDAQVNQRARMKLMSQVAAAFGSTIAIPKEGIKSARNLFIKSNFSLSSAQEGEAQVSVIALQLTKGHTALGTVNFDETDAQNPGYGSGIAVTPASNEITKIVAIFVGLDAAGKLNVVDSAVANAQGAGTAVVIRTTELERMVQGGQYSKGYAFVYGIRANNADADAKFAEYGVTSATDIAKLVASRTLNESDYAFTETMGGEVKFLQGE